MSRKDDWRKLTAELGFEFKEGVNAFLDSPTLRRFAAEEMNQKDIRQAESMLRNPMVQTILAKVFMGTASGRYRDFRICPVPQQFPRRCLVEVQLHRVREHRPVLSQRSEMRFAY